MNRWGSFGAKGGVVPPSVFNQLLKCADQIHFILHYFLAYLYFRQSFLLLACSANLSFLCSTDLPFPLRVREIFVSFACLTNLPSPVYFGHTPACSANHTFLCMFSNLSFLFLIRKSALSLHGSQNSLFFACSANLFFLSMLRKSLFSLHALQIYFFLACSANLSFLCILSKSIFS